MAKKPMKKYKETQVTEPQGRSLKRYQLERVIEAEEAPENAVEVSADTPLSDWRNVGEVKE